MSILNELKIVLEKGTVMVAGDKPVEMNIMDFLSHLQEIFQGYNPNISDIEEVVKVLIDYAIENKNGEIVEEVLDTITNSQRVSEINYVNFDVFEEKLDMVSGQILYKYIEILGGSQNHKYIPSILKMKKHTDPIIQEGIEDALNEMSYES